jgi:hypothetical protein
MLDKRALQNEGTYASMEKEIKDIVKKLNLPELSKKYKPIMDDIGECFMSCMNTTEALEYGDCMCIGLDIERPEEAIADPSRLIIKNIVPSYVSLDTFLESAKFKMQGLDSHEEKAKAVTGGFISMEDKKNKDTTEGAQVIFGLGRESITGLLPLYLFKEHWMVAKRKLGPLFGFMCTLDVMGFSQEQLSIVPFLVMIKALQNHEAQPNEINKKILDQVTQTCQMLMKYNKTIRQ